MNLKDNGVCRCVASKIKEIRSGDRMMVNDDVNVTMTFYKKNEPDKKCGVAKVNGSCDFSLLDAAVAAAAAALVLSLFGAVASILRKI